MSGLEYSHQSTYFSEKTIVRSECFPCVCPEPVLVKRSHLYTNGSKLPFSHTYEWSGCTQSLAASTRRQHASPCEHHAFSQLFLLVMCRSRACLGKKIFVFGTQNGSKCVFRTAAQHPQSQPASCRWSAQRWSRQRCCCC